MSQAASLHRAGNTLMAKLVTRCPKCGRSFWAVYSVLSGDGVGMCLCGRICIIRHSKPAEPSEQP